MAMCLADPLPGFCSVCYGSPSEGDRFVDAGVAFDGVPVLDREAGTIAMLPWSGEQAAHDALFLCEACVREMGELLAFKPERHAALLRELRRLENGAEHWRDYGKRQEQEAVKWREYAERLEADKNIPRPRQAGRVKVAA